MATETLVVNAVTLLLSMTAVGATFVLTLRRIRLMNNADQLPFILALFKELRSAGSVHSEERTRADLAPGAGSEHGIRGVRQPLRDDVHRVCAFYRMLACLVAFRVVEEDLVFLATTGRTGASASCRPQPTPGPREHRPSPRRGSSRSCSAASYGRRRRGGPGARRRPARGAGRRCAA